MIEIVTCTSEHRKVMAALDPYLARELSFNPGIVPGSAVTAVDGSKVVGAGYLLTGPGRFLHLMFVTDTSAFVGVEAARRLIERLKDIYYARKKPGEVLRLWCNANDRRYLKFLKDFGFEERDIMFRMTRKFSGVHPKPHPYVKPHYLSDRASMDAYLAGTEEAFGFPDREEEMSFRLQFGGGKLYTRVDEETGENVSFLTTWPVRKDTAATENIFTRIPFRNRGYATELIEFAAETLKKEGFANATLNVYKSDVPAIRLYEKCGYKKTDVMLELWLKKKV